jgi:hypothetical protein
VRQRRAQPRGESGFVPGFVPTFPLHHLKKYLLRKIEKYLFFLHFHKQFRIHKQFYFDLLCQFFTNEWPRFAALPQPSSATTARFRSVNAIFFIVTISMIFTSFLQLN